MKSLILFFATLFALVSCVKSETEVEFDNLKVEAKSHMNDLPAFDYSNPSVFIGSDFGNYFQSMLERGEYEEMLAFTSSKSIEQFGKEVILNFYRNDIDFGYQLGELKSKKEVDGVITLNYPNTIIMAEKTIVRISVIIENDSCKIVLPNKLSDFPS